MKTYKLEDLVIPSPITIPASSDPLALINGIIASLLAESKLPEDKIASLNMINSLPLVKQLMAAAIFNKMPGGSCNEDINKEIKAFLNPNTLTLLLSSALNFDNILDKLNGSAPGNTSFSALNTSNVIKNIAPGQDNQPLSTLLALPRGTLQEVLKALQNPAVQLGIQQVADNFLEIAPNITIPGIGGGLPNDPNTNYLIGLLGDTKVGSDLSPDELKNLAGEIISQNNSTDV